MRKLKGITLAHTTNTSAMGELVIQFLDPETMKLPSDWRRRRVSILREGGREAAGRVGQALGSAGQHGHFITCSVSCSSALHGIDSIVNQPFSFIVIIRQRPLHIPLGHESVGDMR